MADNFGDDLIEGMKDMLAYVDGKTEDVRVHVIDVPDATASARLDESAKGPDEGKKTFSS